jgi:hypothetical protein
LPTDRPERSLQLLLAIGAAPIVLLGLAPEWISSVANAACRGLFG